MQSPLLNKDTAISVGLALVLGGGVWWCAVVQTDLAYAKRDIAEIRTDVAYIKSHTKDGGLSTR